MNDNRNHIGSNWGGGTPRTMDEAFGIGRNDLLAAAKARESWRRTQFIGAVLSVGITIGMTVGFFLALTRL